MSNASKKTGLTIGFMVVVTGILVLVNLISTSLFGRADLTQDKVYSLSDMSKNLMKSLDEQVFAKAYFTSDLPAPYNAHARFLKDLFSEYAAYSGGKFKFEFIDPSSDDKLKNEMMVLGIPAVNIQELKDDKFQVKQAFLGVAFYYLDKKEVIPLVKSTQGLEYELTSTLLKLTSDRLKTIGFLQGHDEPKPNEDMSQNTRQLERNYKVQAVDLGGDRKMIPPDLDALMVIAPSTKIEDADLFQIDQFLMRGKPVAFLVDSVKVDMRSFQGTNVESNLPKLLRHYGIGVNQDLVADMQAERIQLTSMQGNMRMTTVQEYPLFPRITDFNKENTLTNKLDVMTFPFLSSLTVDSPNDRVTTTVLARSSKQSWLQSGFYQINPSQMQPPQNPKVGPFPVMAMAKGRFASYFADKATSSEPYIGDPSQVMTESPDTRILVIGDGSFVLNDYQNPRAAAFLASIADWLVQDDGLISMRVREIRAAPLPQLENWQRNTIKYFNMIGVPVLFVLFGVLRWQLRKARRKGFQMSQGSR